MYRHYKYYIDHLITELENSLKSDEWYYNLNLFQFQQVLIKFSYFSKYLHGVCLWKIYDCFERSTLFDWALGGPSFGGPGKSKMAAWDAGGFKMAGVSAQYSILNFIGCSHRRFGYLRVAKSFSRSIYPSALHSPMHTYVHHEVYAW